jgi:hypothetical protein
MIIAHRNGSWDRQTCREGCNADVLDAALALAGGATRGQQEKMRDFGVLPPGEARGLFTRQQALENLRKAYGAVPEEGLPPAIAGYAPSDLLAQIEDWYGDKGLEKFRRRLTTRDDKTIVLYSVTMLEQWAQANAEALERVVAKRWTRMPLEKAAVWAASELAARKGVAPESLLSATPTGLFVQTSDYPAFMELFRGNKAALAGEEIAEAIGRFRGDVLEALEGIRRAQLVTAAAIDRNTDAVGGLRGGSAGIQRAIGVNTLTNILLRFAR